jgi:hypothetical protein
MLEMFTLYLSINMYISFSFTVYLMINYYNDSMEEREIIDVRNTSISEYSEDFENGIIYKCLINDPCYFNCSYIRNNLHKIKDVCIYDDNLNIWFIVICSYLFIVICGCVFIRKIIIYRFFNIRK